MRRLLLLNSDTMFVDVLFQKAKPMGKKHILFVEKTINDFNNKNTVLC